MLGPDHPSCPTTASSLWLPSTHPPNSICSWKNLILGQIEPTLSSLSARWQQNRSKGRFVWDWKMWKSFCLLLYSKHFQDLAPDSPLQKASLQNRFPQQLLLLLHVWSLANFGRPFRWEWNSRNFPYLEDTLPYYPFSLSNVHLIVNCLIGDMSLLEIFHIWKTLSPSMDTHC